MHDCSPTVGLLQEACLHEPARMFRYGLKVPSHHSRELIDRTIGIIADYLQDFDAPMISDSLEVPLHLS